MVPFMAIHPHLTNLVWRSIKRTDMDRNGFLSTEELEGCFREHFASELDGKSLIYYFRKCGLDHDKDLVNYRLVKDQLMEKVAQHVPSSPP